MPRILPTFTQVREGYLRDVKNQLPDADTGADSDHGVRANAAAGVAEGIYGHQKWIERQIFPDTSDPDVLERHAAVRGLALKAATTAAGFLRVLGAPGTAVPAGQEARTVDNRAYRTSVAGVIDAGGYVDIATQAVIGGSAGNAAAGTAVTLNAAPAGVSVDAQLLSMQGGVERETHGQLLVRLLEVIRRPPAGGNRHDFRRWAMEVPGVTEAYPYPLRRGLGTIDVAVVSGDGLPSEQILQAVRDHVESVRPVTAKNFWAFAPTERFVDVTVRVRLSGLALPTATVEIEKALRSQFLEMAPGTTWVRSQAGRRILDVPGVVDQRIALPLENVPAAVTAEEVQWLRLGELIVELLP